MGKLIATTGRQPERLIAIGKTGKLACQIEELLSDEMHDVAFAPNIAILW